MHDDVRQVVVRKSLGIARETLCEHQLPFLSLHCSSSRMVSYEMPYKFTRSLSSLFPAERRPAISTLLPLMLDKRSPELRKAFPARGNGLDHCRTVLDQIAQCGICTRKV